MRPCNEFAGKANTWSAIRSSTGCKRCYREYLVEYLAGPKASQSSWPWLEDCEYITTAWNGTWSGEAKHVLWRFGGFHTPYQNNGSRQESVDDTTAQIYVEELLICAIERMLIAQLYGETKIRHIGTTRLTAVLNTGQQQATTPRSSCRTDSGVLCMSIRRTLTGLVHANNC